MTSDWVCDHTAADKVPQYPRDRLTASSAAVFLPPGSHIVPLEQRLAPAFPPPLAYAPASGVSPVPVVQLAASSSEVYVPESDPDSETPVPVVSAPTRPQTSVRLRNPNVIPRLNVLISRCPEGALASVFPRQYESHYGEPLDTMSIAGRRLKLGDVLKACECRCEYHGTSLVVYPTIDPVGVPKPKRARFDAPIAVPAAVAVTDPLRPRIIGEAAPPSPRSGVKDTATYDVKVQRIIDIIRKSQGLTASEITHEYKVRYGTDLVLTLADGTLKPLHKVLVGLKNVRYKSDKFERNVYTVLQ
jgi:hypothetical protein